ncbi:hypothetical protein AVEN_117698-1 [Araneus ventricosus]|uniref:ATP-dependent DNA helicase n=1 Tax=Araneus ventricosus TaxID=182803 RepID=A0A4Y2RES7_ARAVE|nr:hypothetical protein AVEN_117698-1 [Araneus ventricosus]
MSRRILDGDGTTHSLLQLPQALAHTENPIYNASKRSGMAIVQQTCKLLIWYECTMLNKSAGIKFVFPMACSGMETPSNLYIYAPNHEIKNVVNSKSLK